MSSTVQNKACLEQEAAEVDERRVLVVVGHVAPQPQDGAELGRLHAVAGNAVDPPAHSSKSFTGISRSRVWYGRHEG